MVAVEDTARVLLVDDDPGILSSFRHCLADAGHSVTTASDAAQCEEVVQSDVFDLCFLDLRLGETSGLELLPHLREVAPWMRVVIVTGQSSIDSALGALHAGAADYLVKPCSAEQLRMEATKQLRARRLQQRLETLERSDPSAAPDELYTSNPVMRDVIRTLRQVANTDATVLILGESGTGKSLVARMIHNSSQRERANFVTLSCQGLSAQQLESELFGQRQGSEHKLGRAQLAEGGTLFLDEVGDVPPALQAKLLRFIQYREYERVGDPVARPANVRLVAAANGDLATLVQQGLFRADLLYLLNVIALRLPPLRERREDLAALAEGFVLRYAADYRRPARRLAPSALAAIRAYAWPGNIRELQNVIERAVILSPREDVDVEQLSIAASPDRRAQPRIGDALSLAEVEKHHIRGVLASSPSPEAAASTLGIDVVTLHRKRKEHGL